jgi:hypothetical protein
VDARIAAHGGLRDAIGSSAHLFTLLDPDALGPRNAQRAYRGERNFLETGFFAGRVVLLLALVGAAAGMLRERRVALPLIALSALGFVAAYDGPGLAERLAYIPGFDQIRLRRATQIAALPIALLAGLGIDALRAAGVRHKSLPAPGVAGLALAVCLVPWLLLHPLGLAERDPRPDVGVASYLVLALAGVAATLLAAPFLRGHARGVLMALLVLGVAAEGAWVWRDFVPTAESSQTRPHSPLLEGIARDGGGKLLALGRILPPEIPSLFGAPALRSYDAIGLARLRDLKQRTGAFRMPESAQITRGLPAPLLDLLGVRFVLADANAVNLRLPEIGPGAARPALELEKLAPGVVVLRRPTSLPVAYRASAWTTVANEKRALSAVLAPSFDPHRQTVIESTAEWDTAQSPGPGDRIEPLAVTRARPESLRVALPDRRGGLVVVTESYARGWRAYADGEEVPVMAANAFARAAFAPKGTRVLEFVYRPRGFRLALSVTGLAVLGILGLFARDLRRARET